MRADPRRELRLDVRGLLPALPPLPPLPALPALPARGHPVPASASSSGPIPVPRA
ncbi:hypothetical protein OG875_30045 [Streptomyces sp. NBC_01498]|uniref:hypothetical protein n=1 Tax=Streptomyces sp. NBC_01498 TaxID=2975870 RepID=UPI002E7C3B3A|nr:hypothetical protein [Streptomyces sp. NBC_01498]WTL28456.1 hypothetical protein OG875_30045 [Streptomyces sp. NBC_01498]